MTSTRRVPSLLLAIVLVAATGALLLPWLAHLSRTVVRVSDIASGQGKAFVGALSDPHLGDHDSPTGAQVYLIEVKRGTPLHNFAWCDRSYACTYLSALLDANFWNATHEARTAIGPGGALHKDISELGGGRYSVWHGQLYFSLPDGASITRVKAVEVEPRSALRATINAAASALGWIRDAGAALLCIYLAFPFLRRAFEWMGHNVVPGLAITAAIAVAAAGSAEVYFRHSQKFTRSQNVWPYRFVPDVGTTFEPGKLIKSTDGMEYWASMRANSLGFADAEPKLPKPEDTFRILIVGDSFVEAIQVALEQKVQTVLAESLRKKHPDKKLDVVALGMSGAGQINELPFYERSRRELAPDLVILVFVNNDFSNNSALLEAVRQGWDPDHAPSLFMRNDCTRIPIAADWRKHLLPATTPAERVKLLRARSQEIDLKFGSWDGTQGIDWTFYSTGKLPPVFEEALTLTKCGFAEWKKLAARDGFSLLVAAVEQVEQPSSTGQIDRLRQILDELGLPLLNLRPEFAKRGDIDTARWKFDGHWTPTGHRWAAEAIAEYLDRHDMLKALP
jgi:hypothetical protein